MEQLTIDNIGLSSLLNEPHVQFHDNYSVMLVKRPKPLIETWGMSAVLKHYLEALDDEKAALDIMRKHKGSRPLTNFDNNRDATCRGFIASVKALRYHFDQEVRNASQRIMDVFKHYGDIPGRSYDAETAAINDLLRELDTDERTADLKTLKVMDWRDRLDAENQAFDSMTHERFKEVSESTHLRMKNTRTVTDKYYRLIVQHVDFLVASDEVTPELIKLINDSNAIVAHYRHVIAQRAGRTHHHAEKSEETPEKSEP